MLSFVESTGIAQVEDPAANIGAEDSTVQTMAGEPSAVEFAATSVAAEVAIPITIPEVSVTSSVSDEPVVGLTPAQVELVSVSRSVIERWSESASAGLSPVLAQRSITLVLMMINSCSYSTNDLVFN